MKITRADIDLVGNLVGCRPGLALFIEQQQAGHKDAVAGIPFHPSTMGQKGRQFNAAATAETVGENP
jgi:hypothetical protein